MRKLLVFMIDALCSGDIEYMKTLPHFRQVLDNGSYVHHLLPTHPALTYSCHTSIVTGRYVDGHGICCNEKLERGCLKSEVWFGLKEEIKVPTLLDHARDHGLTTCSLSWPVTGGADYTYNMPMIIPYNYTGYHPEQYLEGYASDNLMQEYFWKYGRLMKGAEDRIDAFTMALAPDIIRDHGQPDVMLVKMCDLDGTRHHYGVFNEQVREQLRKHDEEFGVLLESVRRYGDYDNTNFIIMGDHGQTDVDDVLNLNKLFANEGLIRYDSEGNITSWDVYAHSCCLSCYVELADPNDQRMYDRVKALLEGLKDDPEIRLWYVLDKEQMKERYHLSGPFDFVIESRRNISFAFSDNMNIPSIWQSRIPGDHHVGMATHGSCPERAENTLFIASGPSVKKGVVIEQANMVDEAVTMARMIGFEMPDTDGRLLTELLADC